MLNVCNLKTRFERDTYDAEEKTMKKLTNLRIASSLIPKLLFDFFD